MKRGADNGISLRSRSFALAYMCATLSGSLYGRPRRNRSSIRLKMALLRPMPIASVSNASSVNPGDFSNWRNAKRRSLIMGVTGSDASIDGGSYEELLELNAQGIGRPRRDGVH